MPRLRVLRYARRSMLVYAATIFLSAFLLFQVQPMIAKFILPWFGGSAAVWTACLVFFQGALLLGYFLAHWLTSRASHRTQARVYLSLLGLSLAPSVGRARRGLSCLSEDRRYLPNSNIRSRS